MSVTLTINGTGYDYPETNDQRWGADATDWAVAVTNGMLQKAGGLFQLLADVDFGTSYGLKSTYYKSRATNPASAGQLRLGNNESVSWRDVANGSDLALKANASDRLEFNSVILPTISSSDTLTNKTINGPDNTITNLSNTNIAANAAIDFSKLAALTSGNILVGNGSNVAASVSMSGDITISNAGVTAIGANKVTNAMLAQVATARFKGRTTAGSGDVEDLTASQATALLDAFTGDSGSGGVKGLVPAPAAGDAAAFKFLSAGGTWTVPTGAGDVVGPVSSTDNGFVRFDGTTGKIIKNSAATISNSDVSASAAIDFSKLAALTSSYILVGNGSNVPTAVAVTGDISITNAGVTAIGTGVIVDADINASAAITRSKTASGTAYRILANNASGVMSENAAITASRAVASDANGQLVASATTATELGYVSGVTSAIQTQLDAKVAKSTLTAKGSILTATAASTPAEITVGTNDYTLRADSGQSTGLKWVNVGEVVQDNRTGETWSSIASGNQWGDILSITLSSGTWQISANAVWLSSGATTAAYVNLGISTTSGNSSAGLVFGSNYLSTIKTTTSDSRNPMTIASYIVTPSTGTTYYLKGYADSSSTNLQVAARMTAVRLK